MGEYLNNLCYYIHTLLNTTQHTKEQATDIHNSLDESAENYNIMNEKSQSHTVTYCIILFIYNSFFTFTFNTNLYSVSQSLSYILIILSLYG